MVCKGKNTSFNIRQLIIFHREQGKSYRQISSMLGVSKSTVADIIWRFRTAKRIESVPQTGRPSLLSIREKRSIARKVKQNPQLCAPRLISEVLQESSRKVLAETIRKTLRQTGYNGRVARKKLFINEVNRRKRINFAKELIPMDKSWWEWTKVNLTSTIPMEEPWCGGSQIQSSILPIHKVRWNTDEAVWWSGAAF